MADDRQVTTEDVLEAVRRRRPLCDEVAVDDPVTAGKVLAAFEARMEQRPDLGVVNRALNVFLEPRNPFRARENTQAEAGSRNIRNARLPLSPRHSCSSISPHRGCRYTHERHLESSP